MNERALQMLRGDRLPSYLADLAVLTSRPVAADELTSLAQTEALRLQTGRIPPRPRRTWLGPFAVLSGSGFATLVARLQGANGSPIFLWPPRADDCGALRLASLADVSFQFAFKTFPPGLFGIVTEDARDKLVLDFFEDDAGPNLVEIHLTGEHWSQVDVAECLGASMAMGF